MCCTKIIIAAVLIGVGVVILSVGAGVGFGVFPGLVSSVIEEQVALKEGSEAWDMWVELPIPLRFKVYFMSVANPLEVTKGEKPIILERGPYIYKEFKKKEILDISEDKTEVTYMQHTTFEYDDELSGDLKVDDYIVLLNAAAMGGLLTADKDESGATLNIVLGALKPVFGEDSLFSNLTVDEWLFAGQKIKCTGHPPLSDPALFCAGLKSDLPDTIRPDPESEGDFLYSYFDIKLKPDGVYTINTGVKDASKLGTIVKWGHTEEDLSEILPFWAGPECNKILGTDAAIFPPGLTPETRVDIFSTDLCRSLYAVYEKDITYEGVPGLRYIASDDQLGTVHESPENYCYCDQASGCLQRGTLDLFPCMAAPIVLNFPHFYQAEEYTELVDGLRPNKELHETYLDLEPNTGVPLSGGKRVMFSMMIKPLGNAEFSKDLPSALVPLLWIDEGLDLDPPNVQRLKDDVLGTFAILDGLTWGAIGVGIFTTVGGAIFLIWLCLC